MSRCPIGQEMALADVAITGEVNRAGRGAVGRPLLGLGDGKRLAINLDRVIGPKEIAGH